MRLLAFAVMLSVYCLMRQSAHAAPGVGAAAPGAPAVPRGSPRPRPAPGSAAAAAPHTDRFRVDASVAGVIRRDLREIGKALFQYVELPNAFRIRGAAQVEHREKKKVYRFQLDMTFRLEGRRLTVLAESNRFSEDSAEIRKRVERVAPFFHLLRTLPIPPEADDQTRSFLAKHGYFVVRYSRSEAGIEAVLLQDDELVGRFRLARTPAGTELDRVEIPATENVMVLFTRKASEEL